MCMLVSQIPSAAAKPEVGGAAKIEYRRPDKGEVTFVESRETPSQE